MRPYASAVYAGVLGKVIGVYLGRPVEGWPYERIRAELGEVTGYLQPRIGGPLVAADDDLSGTFGFFRALADNSWPDPVSPAQVGRTWLNYIIEDRTVLWWGGLGRSTEHTAYLRLKSGVEAPRSGTIALNGATLAQQIGAQIFIDAFAMAAPGDPGRACAAARAAASVSHDGIALDAAGFLAAIEALAFQVRPLDDLLDQALPYAGTGDLRRLVDDVRGWCAAAGGDWRAVRELIDQGYGYGRYPGPCPMVTNHAMVLAALLLGGDDFQRSVTIAASAGWDTDCNAGSVGCVNGIRLGLPGLTAGADLRAPVADRLLVVTADGGACVTDAVQQTRAILRAAAAWRGEPAEVPRARFAFEYPGSRQGFTPCPYLQPPYPTVRLASAGLGLEIHYDGLAPGAEGAVSTPTWIDPEAPATFQTLASPTLYPGQRVVAHIRAHQAENPQLRFYVLVATAEGPPRRHLSDPLPLVEGDNELVWTVPEVGLDPVARFGVALSADRRRDGTLTLRNLDWSGAPRRFAQTGMLMTSIWDLQPLWLRSWVSSAQRFEPDFTYTYCVSHPGPEGVATIGTADWTDYEVSSALVFSLHRRGGLVLRANGHRRYYAAVFEAGERVSILRRRDDDVSVLTTGALRYQPDQPYRVAFRAAGPTLRLCVSDLMLEARDEAYGRGGAGFLIEEGTVVADGFTVAAVCG